MNQMSQLKQKTLEAQQAVINEALQRHYGNISAVAREQGITRATVRRIINGEPLGFHNK